MSAMIVFSCTKSTQTNVAFMLSSKGSIMAAFLLQHNREHVSGDLAPVLHVQNLAKHNLNFQVPFLIMVERGDRNRFGEASDDVGL